MSLKERRRKKNIYKNKIRINWCFVFTLEKEKWNHSLFIEVREKRWAYYYVFNEKNKTIFFTKFGIYQIKPGVV